MARILNGWRIYIACGIAALLTAGCASTVAVSHPVAPSSPAHASASSARGGTGTAVIGKAYPFVMSVHCGVPLVGFDGRDWEPTAPVPVYPGPRPVNGVVTDTGSVDGMLMLTGADTLRFTANIHHVAAPFVVTFQRVPAMATPVTQAACG